MKNIKLILLSAIVAGMLASCGMNTARNTASPTPKATDNVSNTNNGRVEEDNRNSAGNMTDKAGDAANNVGDTAGNIVRDAGDAVGDAADSAGDIAKDAIDGAGDAVGMNDANGNGQ